MLGKNIINYLRNGKRVYGTLIVSTSTKWPLELKKTGIDFVFIDIEHIAIDRTTLSWMCQTFRALELAPIVRIPSPDPYQATMALDGGASGIIAPYIEEITEVKKLVGAVKYRPIKGEKLKRIIAKDEECKGYLKKYVEKNNENNILLVNIESKPALDNLDEILNVKELDGILIGPHDLSTSLEIPEKYDNQKFINTVNLIIKKARSKNKGAGIHFWADIKQEIKWIKEAGANLIIHSGDISVFIEEMTKQLNKIKIMCGDKVVKSDFEKSNDITI